MVVIDSLTFYFRQDFEDMALRTRILGEMALKLMKLAHKFNLAVSESLALKLFPVVRCTWAEQTDESLLDVSLTN